MQVSNNFWLREFIDPVTYKQYGDRSIWFIDPKVIDIVQLLRERMDAPLTINDWYKGGQYQFSGFRPPSCTVGATKSQHRFGRALDVKMLGMEDNGADDLRDEIINNFEAYRKLGLTTIESEEFSPTWLHMDIRWMTDVNLLIVKP